LVELLMQGDGEVRGFSALRHGAPMATRSIPSADSSKRADSSKQDSKISMQPGGGLNLSVAGLHACARV
jgi:hypothetical protein